MGVIMGSSMQELSDRERGILRNSLGLLYSKWPYRNHFATNHGCDTHEICLRLTEMGYMEHADPGEGQRHFFYTTKEGAAAVGVDEDHYLAALK
jgi:hypothetical protein